MNVHECEKNEDSCLENVQCTNTEGPACYTLATLEMESTVQVRHYIFEMETWTCTLSFYRGRPCTTMCIHIFLSRVHKLRKMDVETKTETKIGSENNTERFRYMCFLFCQEIVFIMLYQTCWNTMHPFVWCVCMSIYILCMILLPVTQTLLIVSVVHSCVLL